MTWSRIVSLVVLSYIVAACPAVPEDAAACVRAAHQYGLNPERLAAAGVTAQGAELLLWSFHEHAALREAWMAAADSAEAASTDLRNMQHAAAQIPSQENLDALAQAEIALQQAVAMRATALATFEGALPQVPAVALIRGKITGPDYQRGLPAWADLYVTSDRATLLRALRAQTIADRLGRPLDPEYQDTIDDALDIPAVATAKTLQEQATPSVQAVFATWLQGGE